MTEQTTSGSSLLRLTWRQLRRSPMAMIGLTIVGLLVLTAVSADLLTVHLVGFDPYEPDRSITQSPTAPDRHHLLGTDDLRRDLLARIIHGSRISLQVGIVAELIALTIGVVVGSLAGYYGGWVDGLLMRVTDIFFAIPTPLLAIAVMASFPEPEAVPLFKGLFSAIDHIPVVRHFFDPSLFIIFAVLGFISWASIARLIRGEILTIKEMEYSQAARALGVRDRRIIFRHVLPNAVAPVIVAATIGVAGNILTEAWLSFLGLGAQPPLPSWGAMITEGQSYLITHPWVCIFPGIAISLTVLGFNLLGDGLRDVLDPRLHD